MSTLKFKKQMGKKQEFKKEAPGFFDRWVHGTGGQQGVCRRVHKVTCSMCNSTYKQ
jgi:hypothetical protein